MISGKSQGKLLIKIADLIAECELLYGIRIVHGDTVKMKHVKRLSKKLYTLKQEENIEFVYGTGRRKSALQKSIETLEGYLERLKGYTQKLHVLRKKKQFLKNRSGCDFYAHEGRCYGQRTVKTGI